jgi:hypothetical protein
MIRITDFNSLVADMVKAIPGIAGFVLVGNENHLVKRLSDKKGVQLGITIPSADPETVDEDNVAESNIAWIFVLEKVDPGSMTHAKEIEHYQKMQDLTTSVKNWLRDQKLAGNEFLENLNLKSVHTDPEYQFGGWNGWSINFNFETDGY